LYHHHRYPSSEAAAHTPCVDRTGNYQAIDLSQRIASNPSYLLADHFGKPQAVFEGFKRNAHLSPRPKTGRDAAKSGSRIGGQY
jgi:hypothetical protein